MTPRPTVDKNITIILAELGRVIRGILGPGD